MNDYSSRVQQVVRVREGKQYAVGQIARLEVGLRSKEIPSISSTTARKPMCRSNHEYRECRLGKGHDELVEAASQQIGEEAEHTSTVAVAAAVVALTVVDHSLDAQNPWAYGCETD